MASWTARWPTAVARRASCAVIPRYRPARAAATASSSTRCPAVGSPAAASTTGTQVQKSLKRQREGPEAASRPLSGTIIPLHSCGGIGNCLQFGELIEKPVRAEYSFRLARVAYHVPFFRRVVVGATEPREVLVNIVFARCFSD